MNIHLIVPRHIDVFDTGSYAEPYYWDTIRDRDAEFSAYRELIASCTAVKRVRFREHIETGWLYTPSTSK